MNENELVIIAEMNYVDLDGEVIAIEDYDEAIEFAMEAKIENPDKVIIVIPGRIIITDEKTEAKESFSRNTNN